MIQPLYPWNSLNHRLGAPRVNSDAVDKNPSFLVIWVLPSHYTGSYLSLYIKIGLCAKNLIESNVCVQVQSNKFGCVLEYCTL